MLNRNQLIAIAAVALIVAAMAYFSFLSAPGKADGMADGNKTDQYEHAKNQTGFAAHLGAQGDFQTDDFKPEEYLASWNYNNLPDAERKKYYQETALPDNTTLREYWIDASDAKIEVAPGVFYDAWVFNGEAPGPTIRAAEGDTVRVHFKNAGSKPHTMHFHGYHEAEMDGSLPEQFVMPNQNVTYEFKAGPAGLHLYHCHSTPLKDHIAHGLYGMYIVDPRGGREPAQELVMMLNAFDTNFDGENEVYAVNTMAFYYMRHPIKVKRGELVRIYVANMVEFDPINSIHIHGNFFEEYRTGTGNQSDAFTDIIELGQGERSMLEMRFPFTGQYMFHAHQTEFSELGWMGMFEVEG